MGNSKFVNEPTIGGRTRIPERTTGDGRPPIDKNNRALAQPLPGKQVEEVKEKTSASAEEKADALTKHSKLKKTYDENDVSRQIDPFNSAAASEDVAPADVDPHPVNPSFLIDAPQADAFLDNAPGTSELPAVEDDSLDGKDPLDS